MKKVAHLLPIGIISLCLTALPLNVIAEEMSSSSTITTSSTMASTTEISASEAVEATIDLKKAFSRTSATDTPTKTVTSITLEKEKNFLKTYLDGNYITLEQYNQTLSQLTNATSDEEITTIMSELESQLDDKALLAKWSFTESYINIKANITGLIENGSLSKEQGEDFLAQLENCTTKEELTALWNKVQDQVKLPESSNTTSSTVNSISTVDSQIASSKELVEKKKENPNTLPQTGEKNEHYLISSFGGSLLVIGEIALTTKFRRFTKLVE